MKKIIFLMMVFSVLFFGCDFGSSKITSKKQTRENCIEPYNPYNDGGGHDAGFNWARDTGGDCNGNSDSFNEGCEEYYNQLNRYNECITNSR